MAISRITASGVATDTLTAADIADDAIGTAELANDVVISTSGAITTTGAFTSVGIDDNASGATAITIDSSENVGIGGVTPKTAWRSNCKAIQIGTQSALWLSLIHI